jgi:hypothetical protein
MIYKYHQVADIYNKFATLLADHEEPIKYIIKIGHKLTNEFKEVFKDIEVFYSVDCDSYVVGKNNNDESPTKLINFIFDNYNPDGVHILERMILSRI